MASKPQLTRNDRAERHRQIVAAYRGGMTSRAVAAQFSMTDSHVRAVVRLYGVARSPGWRGVRDDRGRFA